MSPTFKKNDRPNKENCRHVSVISHVSKVIERLMYKQLVDFMKDQFSSLLTGFRKNHSKHSKHARGLKKKKKVDNGKIIGGIFMDLSKAFDAINDDLLIVKLEGYGLFYTVLMYVRSYLNNWKRVNVHNIFSSSERLISGAPVTWLYLSTEDNTR